MRGWRSVVAGALCVCVASVALGCGAAPVVRYYQLAPRVEAAGEAAPWTLGVEYLSADAAYEDARMVYRESRYRLDYYHYHRWTAPPALMVSDVLRRALQEGGAFARVEAGYTSRADVLLRGRIVALEEVDGEGRWVARLVLDMHAVNVATNATIWSGVIEREREMNARTGEALAEAVSEEIAGVAAELGGELVEAKRSYDARVGM
jgi:ABC-type uncharacterized transport system auxiliary subunit